VDLCLLASHLKHSQVSTTGYPGMHSLMPEVKNER